MCTTMFGLVKLEGCEEAPKAGSKFLAKKNNFFKSCLHPTKRNACAEIPIKHRNAIFYAEFVRP